MRYSTTLARFVCNLFVFRCFLFSHCCALLLFVYRRWKTAIDAEKQTAARSQLVDDAHLQSLTLEVESPAYGHVGTPMPRLHPAGCFDYLIVPGGKISGKCKLRAKLRQCMDQDQPAKLVCLQQLDEGTSLDNRRFSG